MAGSDPAETEFRLLGPFEVRQAGQVLPVPGKQRVLLAALLLPPGRVVPVDDLIEALWGPAPPLSAVASLHNYVARLRRALGAGPVIATEPGGYWIAAAPGQLDVARFEAALAAGQAAARDGSWAAAAALLAQGLALWRGEPLAGVDSELLAYREVPRLAELRWQAIEARAQAELRLGRADEVAAELAPLAAAAPLRERLHALLMLALYQAGRQAAALAAYQDARRALLRELGAEPGAALQRLQQQILTRDPALVTGGPGSAERSAGGPGSAGRAPPPPIRHSLPPDTASFTGRQRELDLITAAVIGASASGVVTIQAIGGMPGIGKSALAVHAAHALRDRFPDRQLFVDLAGHTPGQDPADPAAALAGLLAAVGVDTRHLPPGLDDRAALWRDRMAGLRTLLVLDNAASSAQVAPLLPSASGCLVLVTSRRHLADLPGAVVPVQVGVLAPDEAAAMFTRLAPAAAGHPQVAELVALAGNLPLAISLLARVLHRHGCWSLADLAAETRASLLTMSAEQDSVAAAFDVSWRHLDPAQRELLALLGLHPGTTASVPAAAALAGVPLPCAAALLDALHGEGLLAETSYRRYSMHDLIRQYAARHAAAMPAATREAALARLLDYYQRAAAHADAVQSGRPRPTTPGTTTPGTTGSGSTGSSSTGPGTDDLPDLPDAAAALAWARTERVTLLACLDHAAGTGDRARMIALTAALTELLRRDGPWTEAIARHAAAAAAARALGDKAALAGALGSLGSVRRLSGDYPGAARDLGEALGIFRDLGDRGGTAGTLHALADTWRLTASFPAASSALEEALGIVRELGDRPGQARVLATLGDMRRLTGDFAGATAALEESARICRGTADRLGLAGALNTLGGVRHQLGDFPGAVQDLGRALAIYRGLDDGNGQTNTLISLGYVRMENGDLAQALRDLTEALALARGIGIRLCQANALSLLGQARREAGDLPAAARHLADALAIFQELGSGRGRANCLLRLGAVRREDGDLPGADAALGEALSILRGIGDRVGEAEALNETGVLRLASGDLAGAADCHRQALDLARAVASPRDEARALAGLGRCARAAGDDGGTALLRQALEIFRRAGAPETAVVEAELSGRAGRPGTSARDAGLPAGVGPAS